MCTWLSSCPFEVLTKTRSPEMTGDDAPSAAGTPPTTDTFVTASPGSNGGIGR
jgi:hypothetical protein